MEENKLKNIDGIKIRRQYFNIPLVIIYSLMLAIPYFIFISALCMGKLESYGGVSTLWISIWVCFCFSLPILVLRILNKHFFGRIICVLTEEGIHYPKGHLRWETIEKIEYAIDTKPRYKSDTEKAFRAIVYTKGGKHVVLDKAPLHTVSRIRKCRKDININISGATSLLSVTLVMVSVVVLCPFYVALLLNSPGVSVSHLVVSAIIYVVLGFIRIYVFNAYAIEYRFWRRILPKKLLSYVILGCYYPSFFAAILILFYFPNWVVACLVGIYLGIVQPPIPSKHGVGRYQRVLSYEQLYERYMVNSELWEKNVQKNKKKAKK